MRRIHRNDMAPLHWFAGARRPQVLSSVQAQKTVRARPHQADTDDPAVTESLPRQNFSTSDRRMRLAQMACSM
jgi:hypothetical protein